MRAPLLLAGVLAAAVAGASAHQATAVIPVNEVQLRIRVAEVNRTEDVRLAGVGEPSRFLLDDPTWQTRLTVPETRGQSRLFEAPGLFTTGTGRPGVLPGFVGRLFRNVGIGRDTQSMMLGVTPRIIISEEEEPGPFSRNGGRAAHAAAALPAVAAGPIRLSGGVIDSNPPNRPLPVPSAAFAVDHYSCYEAGGDGGGKAVRINDGFAGPLRARVLAAVEVCNPARTTFRKRTAAIRDPRQHLVCYRVAAGARANVRLRARNRLGGAQMLIAGRRALLCAPSSKQVVTGGQRAAPPLRDPLSLDHFACYGARPEGRPRVRALRLADQLQRRTVAARQANVVCHPAITALRGRTAGVRNRHAHLVGYRVEQPAAPRVVLVSNRFGAGQRLVTGDATRILVPTHTRICLTLTGRPNLPLIAAGQRVGTVERVAITPFGGDPGGACPT